MTKLFALGALGAGAFATVRAIKRRSLEREQRDIESSFDFADLDEPVVVSEEVVIVTELEPFEQGIENIENPVEKADDQSFEMPGRGAAPR